MMPAFCGTKHVTARKQHQCCECRGFIEAGDIYEKVAGLWGGQFSTFKTCTKCQSARDFYSITLDSKSFRDSDEGEFCFGALKADLHEAASDMGIGTGQKFRTLRFVVEMNKRGTAAKTQKVNN
jgi:hypothetical protein